MAGSPTRLFFLWHFHQPYYSRPDRTSNALPWVRLHAIKSYYDMGRRLEAHPGIQCVVNFSGSLLEQLREYIEVGKRDSWWDLTEKPASSLTETDRRHLLRHFFSLDWETSVRPIPRYRELLEKRGTEPEKIEPSAFTDQEYRDLQVLFNLAWFGFSAREERAVVQSLLDKGEQYSEDEKTALLEQQIEVMQLLLPLYRRLHQRGQIEISVSPMYHPILPLLFDTDSAVRATPDRPRPERLRAPEDAECHVREARTVVRDVLGVDIDGIWPSEGAVSPETLELFDDLGVGWCASDEEVLERSRGSAWSRADDLYRPWRLGDGRTAMFFRDRTLSDKIGFVYGDAPAEDAADDFMDRLDGIEGRTGESPVVSVILDGENSWDQYPDDGERFLSELYDRVEASDEVETTTPTRRLQESSIGELDDLHSGSWIHGNYQVWIGHEETNRAWDLLRETRQTLVEGIEEVGPTEAERRKIWEALHMAEGSDWFWWYGDDFSTVHDADFDRLFREQLRYVYRMLDEPVPSALDVSIVQERLPKVAYEAPQRLIKPRIDGRSDYYYEWSGAGVYRNTGSDGSMFENTRYVDEIRIGFDLEHLYVRVDPGRDFVTRMADIDLRTEIDRDDVRFEVRVGGEAEAEETEGVAAHLRGEQTSGSVALELVGYRESVEFGVPFDLLDAEPGDALALKISVWDERMEQEHHPPDGTFELEVPDESFELVNWMV